MFIFATNDGIDKFANSSQWFGDGTFKLFPQIFFQIYTNHALVNHEVFPCAFTLLSSKTEIAVCNAVRNNNGNDPDGFLVDLRLMLFEMFYPKGYIRLFLPFFIELVETNPTCWIKRALHERPPIWFTVTYDYCFSLRAPTGRG